MRTFADRHDAGSRLAGPVADLGLRQPLVLALPRGGVPVAAPVAAALAAPLEVFVVRKVGAPGQVELGIGAVTEGGVVVDDVAARGRLGVSDERFEDLAAVERLEVDRRVARYRDGRALPPVAGVDVVVVDDGLATGVTAEAAVRDLAGREPDRLVLAVPVGAGQAVDRLGSLVDHLVCLVRPRDLRAVGHWYRRFDQTTDAEVHAVLATAHRRVEGGRPGGDPGGDDRPDLA